MAFAFVTLVSSDSYLPGALAQVAALKELHPTNHDCQTLCLVTPESLDVATIKALRKAFNLVVGVEILEQENNTNLALLGRPDLTTVLTKLHVFRLVQFQKIIFLDADVLPIRPLDHLFNLPHEFAAVPDVGWPDIFNSGVLVLTPGNEKFDQLYTLMKSSPSWDGGDQGILNEWRGSNWHRLSFTYNTTPTAAYTYAPAYERYGPQISAIHFIGQDKPWNSIPHRAPFSSSRKPLDSLPSQQRAYDYQNLLDRWFDVYDRNYRSHSVPPRHTFQVKRYSPAWEQNPANIQSSSSSKVLDLDILKQSAIQGINAALHPVSLPGEAVYTTLPLEGRIDLMRPRKPEPKSDHPPQDMPQISATPIHELDDSDKLPAEPFAYDEILSTPISRPTLLEENRAYWETLPTPGPHEIPPSPQLPPISLPPTPSFLFPQTTPDFYASESESENLLLSHPSPGHRRSPSQRSEPHSHHSHHHHRERRPSLHHYPPHHRPDPPPRPTSPPVISWNPALEPPPNVVPNRNNFPTDTYFPNVWDQTLSPYRDSHNDFSRKQSATRTFFQPPPPTVIPESLVQQGHYRSVTGTSNTGDTPSPDPSKVKTVFPWETQPRAAPARVFPDSDAPSSTLFLSPSSQSQTSFTTPSTPETKLPPRLGPLSPLQGLPSTLSFANAWDTVPSIQKYASKLVKPATPVPVLAPAFDEVQHRRTPKKSRDDYLELSSRDGDNEDNADDEDDGEPVVTRWDDDDTSKQPPVSRSRSNSTHSSGSGIKSTKKEYKHRAVQTISTERRSRSIQVEPPKHDKHFKKAPTSSKKQWIASPSVPHITKDVGIGDYDLSSNAAVHHQRRKSGSISSSVVSSPIRSPREFIAPANSTHRPLPRPSASRPKVRTVSASSTGTVTPASSAYRTSMTRPSPAASRRPSNDSSLGSPPSSLGPVSPAESHPIAPPVRKGGRVWDPARGVEAFKRSSEEVLARFLRMGSWEEEAP
ncbi:hypothetical protein CVT24_004309 [Panaeolus cyanescens]|uniref:glycogenin glucosyltransferase n=1 Tax=Panaeolus cyanescens TaxID=181874 RepID=A0A409VEM4_9AGAR|nr:hypothetical protein CVT24_004309 [Panaeolus cyanescens]